MSNQINELLFERAAHMIDVWEGTLHAKLIQNSLDKNDLEQVAEDVKRAEDALSRIQFDEHYDPQTPPLTDEELDQVGKDLERGDVPF